MKDKKVAVFKQLAGQEPVNRLSTRDEATRKLGAQLLLSEVLEYVISGLGVTPVIDGKKIQCSEGLSYEVHSPANPTEMIDGLADTAYTMYWNALAFGVPLEAAFDLVCDNNLGKFVRLENWSGPRGVLPAQFWDCGKSVSWPAEVTSVTVLEVGGELFAVGKDAKGKVRKPSTYQPVDLSALLAD